MKYVFRWDQPLLVAHSQTNPGSSAPPPTHTNTQKPDSNVRQIFMRNKGTRSTKLGINFVLVDGSQYRPPTVGPPLKPRPNSVRLHGRQSAVH